MKCRVSRAVILDDKMNYRRLAGENVAVQYSVIRQYYPGGHFRIGRHDAVFGYFDIRRQHRRRGA
jgi:ATP sulfurylase